VRGFALFAGLRNRSKLLIVFNARALKRTLLKFVGVNRSIYMWNGHYFGERSRGSLFTYRGIEAGHFYGVEVYGSDGAYLGELIGRRRLITHQAKKPKRWVTFRPKAGKHYRALRSLRERPMLVGFESFPAPDEFHRE
jgi:hypothetical protein